MVAVYRSFVIDKTVGRFVWQVLQHTDNYKDEVWLMYTEVLFNDIVYTGYIYFELWHE